MVAASSTQARRAAPLDLVGPLAVAVLAVACGRTEPVRYVFGPGDGGPEDAGSDAGRDAGPPDAACAPRLVPFTPAVPTVLFVMDRSGSMDDDLNGNSDAGVSRWTVLSASLKKVLPPRDSTLAMGALLFPSATGDACDVPTGVNLSPRLGNAAAILGLFSGQPEGGTPTWDAIGVAANHLATLHTASSAKALILTTDGAPNCNVTMDPFVCTCSSTPRPPANICPNAESCLDDNRTVARIRTLFQSSQLPTYVIGLGSQLNQFAATLDQMAVAGGVPRTGAGHRYYAVDSEAELTDAFTRITAQLARCTFLTNTTIGPNDLFSVRLGQDVVSQGPPDGWDWVNRANGELALYGLSCDRVLAGTTARGQVECK